MNALLSLLSRFWALFTWWFVVAPWERCLRVRLGKTITEHGPGLHLRVPYVDIIYRQSIRLRFSTVDPQTVTTRDGQTVTVAGVFGFVVSDLRTLYNALYHPDTAIKALVQGTIAQYIYTHDWAECQPDLVEQAVVNEIDIEQYGLTGPQLSLTTYARVKTYRFITDEHGIYSSAPSTTNAEHSATSGPGPVD